MYAETLELFHAFIHLYFSTIKMILSDAALERMGFSPLPTGQAISGVFNALHAYEIRGFIAETEAISPISGIVAGCSYSLSVGSSINAICRQLVQDDFADSEEEWQTEHKCTPPYLIVHLGPTGEHQISGSHVKEENRVITTYDGFQTAREELAEVGERVLPSLLSALSCRFSSHNQPVRFIPIDRAFFGVTSDSRIILDFRMVGNMSAYVSSKLDTAQLEDRLSAGISLASSMNRKVARFFQLALDETDPVKKFLYFFLAIEIETHATFSRIDHADNFSRFISAPTRVASSILDFFDGQRHKWTNLREKFVWCVLCAWTHLSDSDVEEFKRLKKVRDDIAHGTISTPPGSAVIAAEILAAKLQTPSDSEVGLACSPDS